MISVAAVAVLGVAVALVLVTRQDERTVLADAPPGLYAVAIRDDGEQDAILLMSAGDPRTARPIAMVPRLAGFVSYGATSPDGSLVALVTADRGTPAHPVAVLQVVDMRSGAVRRLVEGVDQLQTPAWDGASGRILVTKTSGDGPQSDVDVFSVGTDWSVVTLFSFASILGAYPVGIDSQGKVAVVVIDASGSRLVRDGEADVSLAPGITRDWHLSPDGRQLAYIETLTGNGLRFEQRVVDLAAGGGLPLTEPGQRLGSAWKPGSTGPTFGSEPGPGERRGFDIPIDYSPDGSLLVATAWNGASFEAPGSAELVIIGGSARVTVEAQRFAGWVQR